MSSEVVFFLCQKIMHSSYGHERAKEINFQYVWLNTNKQCRVGKLNFSVARLLDITQSYKPTAKTV